MLSIETCSLRTDISILLHSGLDSIRTILVVCKVFSSKNEILQGQFERTFALELKKMRGVYKIFRLVYKKTQFTRKKMES